MRFFYKYNFFVAILMFLCVHFSWAQADVCSNATDLGTLPTPGNCNIVTGLRSGAAVTRLNQTTVGLTAANPYLYQTNCTGGTMATRAIDGWYTFVATGTSATITINGFPGANIALWQANATGGCTSMFGVECAIVDNTGIGTLRSLSIKPGTRYYIQVSGGTLNATDNNFSIDVKNDIDCNNCLTEASLTASPLPVNGTYSPGQVVRFCYTVSNYQQINTNWFHGVQITMGNGWTGAITNATPAQNCNYNSYSYGYSAGSNGTWKFYPTGVTSSATGQAFGPGFYFDNTEPSNSNPGDNFGDYTYTVNPCSWTFCWDLTVSNTCAVGEDLTVTVNTSGDGESGSWRNIACQDDPPTELSFFKTAGPNVTNNTTLSVCSGSAVNLPLTSSTSPATFTWQAEANANVGGEMTTLQSSSTITDVLTNNTLVPQVVNYLVKASTSGGCAGQDQIIAVTVFPPPTATAGSDVTVCEGGTVNLSGTIGSGATTSLWSAPSGTFSNASSLTSTYTPSITTGSVQLTLTSTNPAAPAGCNTASSTMTVTVNPKATVDAGPDVSTCNSSVNLSGTIGGSATSATWTSSAGGTIGSPTSLNTTFTPPNTTNSSITLTLTTNDPAGPCPAVSDQMVVNIGKNAFANAGPDQTICAGSTVNLAGAIDFGATSGTWSAPSGTFVNANSLNTIYTPSITSGAVTITLTTNNPAGSCQAGSDQMVVNVVNGSATPTAANNGPLCEGETLNLSATGPAGVTYSWTGPNGFTSTLQNPTIPNVTAANAGTYTVSLPASCATGVTDNFNDGDLSLNPTWTVPAGGGGFEPSVFFLEGTTSGSTASTDDRITTPSNQAYGEWQFDFQFEATDNTTQAIRFFFISTNTSLNNGYYVDIRGRDGSGNYILTIKKMVNGVATIISGNYPWSSNGSTASFLTVRVVRDLNNLFSVYLGTQLLGTFTDATFTTSTHIGVWNSGVNASQNHRIDNITTKPIITASTTLVIKTTPLVTNTDLVICSSSSINIPLTSNIASPASTYTWIGPDGTSGTGSTISQPAVSASCPFTTLTYTVTPTNSGCVGTPKDINVKIIPVPTSDFNIPASSICADEPGTVQYDGANACSNATYQWVWPSGISFLAGGNGTGAGPHSFNLPAGNNQQIRLTVQNADPANASFTCPSTQTIASISVKPFATATISGTTTICTSASTNISVALTGTAPWTITYSNGTTNTTVTGINTSPYVFPVSPTATTTYTLVSANDVSCKADLFGTATVTVNSPTAALSGTNSVCVGSTNNISVDLTGTGPWSITYNINSGTPVTVNNITTSPYALPTFTPTSPSTTTYTLTAVSGTVGGNACAGTIGSPLIITANSCDPQNFSTSGSAVSVQNCIASAPVLYNTNGTTIGTQSLPVSLGTFIKGSGNLLLNGAEVVTSKTGSADICGVRMYYAIYDASQPRPTNLSFTAVTLNLYNTSGGIQKWNNTAINNILSALNAGSYKMEVYYEINGNDNGACTGPFTGLFTRKDDNGGANYLTSFSIVNPTTTISYSAASYCNSFNNTSQLPTLSGITGGSYSVSPAGLDISSTGEINPSTSTPGDYTITYTYTDAQGCPNTTQTTVKINPVPEPPTIVGSSVCAPISTGTITSGVTVSGLSYQLFNSSGNAVPGFLPIPGVNGSTLSWNPVPIGIGYYVVATDNNTGCSANSNPVLVNQKPEVITSVIQSN